MAGWMDQKSIILDYLLQTKSLNIYFVKMLISITTKFLQKFL